MNKAVRVHGRSLVGHLVAMRSGRPTTTGDLNNVRRSNSAASEVMITPASLQPGFVSSVGNRHRY